MKVKITHLSLHAAVRQLAIIRSAQLSLNLTDYFSRLVKQDAETAGLTKYLGANDGEVRNAER